MKTYSRRQPARPRDPTEAPTASAPTEGERPKKTKITDYFFKRIDEEDARCRTKAPSRPRNAKTLKPLEQTFLDLGQKGLFMTECPECGMCYDKSFEQDTRRHEIEHRRLFQCFDASKVPHVRAVLARSFTM